ncbi:MAG: B12-binding domain-containing radical SAM protein [bacterium]
MKVLVSNPPWPGPGYGARSDVRWPHKRSDKFIEYPIYLAYVVAVLEKAGIDVSFIDGVVEEMSIPVFASAVKNNQPDMVILECSTPSIDYDLLTVKVLKEKMKNVFIVLVGSHPTFFHENIMRENPQVDAICRGEFDLTVRDLAAALLNGDDLKKVRGITYRDESGIHVNEVRPLIKNLDELPFPARHMVKSDYYRQGTFMGKHSTTMVTSRGCPYRCIFCLWPGTLYGRKFRARSPENIVDEIEQIVKDHHVDEIYFDDDSFALNRPRLLRICELIQKRRIKVKWIPQCRVSSMDEEVVRAMKRAGCHYIRFGVESGSQKMLDVMKKGINLGQIKQAFDLCREAGIRTQAFFLLGIPGETPETIRETMEFAKKLRPDSAQFAVVIPHPGTELYEVCKRKGWLKYEIWEDFSAGNCLIETEKLSRRDVERARIEAYREFYFRPSYIFATAFRLRNLREVASVFKSAYSIVDRMAFFKKQSIC